MTRVPPTSKRWLIPSLSGFAVLGVLVTFFVTRVRMEPPSNATPLPTQPPLTLVRTQPNDHLFELEPLFLPTPYNTSVLKLPVQSRREPGAMGAIFPPKLMISESSGGVAFPELVTPPAGLIQVLSFGDAPPAWPEIGRADVNITEYSPRLAVIEVLKARNGEPVFSETVDVSGENKVPAADWAPLEFLVAIDSGGLVGAPAITGSTNSAEVETFFRNFLRRKFHLGSRVGPGFYTVRIGP